MQRLADKLFGPEFGGKVFCYIDDIVIIAETYKEHIELLHKVYNKLKQAGLTINLPKSEFCKSELKYLGFILDKEGLRTDPAKIECIREFPRPTTVKQIRSFIGLCSYYRKFIKDFSSISAPLTQLTAGEVTSKSKVEFDAAAEEAFKKLKQALISAPVLKTPDFEAPFWLHCDASGCGLGAALVQKDTEGGEHPVAYFSRTLSKVERNYSTTERELLAVVAAVDHFKHYIDGSHFTVVTDHSSLKWLSKLENPTGRLARWATRLSQYDFDIVHKKGALNTVPDVLSRLEVNIVTYDCDSSTDRLVIKLLAGIRRAPTKFTKFKIENNMVFKYVMPRTPLHESTAWKILVPEELRKDLITSTHSHPTNAHLGPYKTLKKLQVLYSWPKMQADVDKVLNTCEVCKAYKPTNQKPLGQMKRPRNVSAPMQSLSMDLVGHSHAVHGAIISCSP